MGEPSESFEHFRHGADLGLRGKGPSLEAAFRQVARALCAAVTDPGTVRQVERVVVRCQADDRELLLYDWVNEVIHEMSKGGRLFSRFEVAIDGPNLVGVLWGERVDRERHEPAVEPKGATFTELAVTQSHHGWVAQCVIDV